MSVLIKGMEMPKTCCDCNFNIAGWCCANLASDRIEFPGRPEWCPLVEVPTPHGRLIDADRLADELEADAMAFEDEHELKFNAAMWLRSSRNKTIIEAEE